MKLERNMVGSLTVIGIAETKLNADNALEFKADLVTLIEEGNQNIILDLGNVDFIDSSGLAAVVSGMKALKGRGDISICSLKDSVIPLFELTRMNRVFKIYKNVENAIASLNR